MATTIKFARGTASQWESINPILAEGEPGFEQDSKKLKIGDGFTRWNDLEYMEGVITGGSDAAIQAHINSATPHPVYDDGPDLVLLYANAKV